MYTVRNVKVGSLPTHYTTKQSEDRSSVTKTPLRGLVDRSTEAYLVAKSLDGDPNDGDGSVSNFCVELRSISQLRT